MYPSSLFSLFSSPPPSSSSFSSIRGVLGFVVVVVFCCRWWIAALCCGLLTTTECFTQLATRHVSMYSLYVNANDWRWIMLRKGKAKEYRIKNENDCVYIYNSVFSLSKKLVLDSQQLSSERMRNNNSSKKQPLGVKEVCDGFSCCPYRMRTIYGDLYTYIFLE